MRIITTRRFLKKIIIFLLIIILLFLFKSNVNASTILQNTLNIEYGESLIENLNTYRERLNNLKTYLQAESPFIQGGINYDLSSGKYILRIQNIDTDTWKVWLLDNSLTDRNYFQSTYNQYSKNIQYYVSSYIWFNVNFSGNNVTSRGGNTIGNTFLTWNVPNDCDITTSNDCISKVTGSYYDTTFYNANSLIPFRSCTANCTEFGFKTGNDIYMPSENVDVKTMFDNLLPNTELQISYEIIKQNGYYDLQLKMENYTGQTIQNGKQVFLIDTSTGKQTFISPDVNGLPNRTMTIQVYFPTTYKYQIIDTNTLEVIYEEIINIPNIEYDNFLIKINNINTQNKTINYSYVNNGNTTNYKCFHQIENGTLLEDTNCTNIDNNYTVNLTQNKNINFIIKDSENNTIFEESRNFVMSMAIPFIEFKENYDYNLLNIKVLFNRFNTNDYIAKYQINNDAIITIMPTQEQTTYNDVYSYIIYNITEKSVIKAFIFDNNNNLIASSTFNVSNTYIQQQNYYNIDSASFKDLFNNLSFKNISSELIDLINRIGNIVLSSRLGIIIFTTFLITLIGLIINLIRR